MKKDACKESNFAQEEHFYDVGRVLKIGNNAENFSEKIDFMSILCYNIHIIYHGGDNMATINVNVDEKVKEQAKQTLEYLGTNFTNVINMLLRQIILTESIPFEIKIPKLNTETIKAIEDTEKGIGLSKGYTDLNEMWRDLEKED